MPESWGTPTPPIGPGACGPPGTSAKVEPAIREAGRGPGDGRLARRATPGRHRRPQGGRAGPAAGAGGGPRLLRRGPDDPGDRLAQPAPAPARGGRPLRPAGRGGRSGCRPGLAKLLPNVIDRLRRRPRRRPGPGAGHPRAAGGAGRRGWPRSASPCVSDRVPEVSEGRRDCLAGPASPVLDRLRAGESGSPLAFGAQLLAARLGVGSVEADAIRERFTSPESPGDIRLRALEALVAFGDPALPDALDRVLSEGSPEFLARVLAALGRSDDRKVAEVVLKRYPAMAPELQPLAVDLLLQREPWARKLLDAVIAGDAAPQHPEPGPPAADHGGQRPGGDLGRGEGVGDHPGRAGPAAGAGRRRDGRVPPARTSAIRSPVGSSSGTSAPSATRCYGEGTAVGPDLTSNGRGSFEQVLASVFDPSLVIGESYRTTTVVTEGGRNLTGLVAEDGDRADRAGPARRRPGGDPAQRGEVRPGRRAVDDARGDRAPAETAGACRPVRLPGAGPAAGGPAGPPDPRRTGGDCRGGRLPVPVRLRRGVEPPSRPGAVRLTPSAGRPR